MRIAHLIGLANDGTLQLLIGTDVMTLVQALDPSLATPCRLRELITSIFSPEEILLDKQKRGLLFDLLPVDEAKRLHQTVNLKCGGNIYEELRTMTVRKNSEREKQLFHYFLLPAPQHEEVELLPTKQASRGDYMLFKHQRKAVREVKESLEPYPHRVILHMPTGSGKTRTAMNVICDHLRQHEPAIVIWLAHTSELCEQAASEFVKAWSYLGNRPVGVYRFWGEHDLTLDDVHDGVVVAGLPKMYSSIRERISFIGALANRTSLVIIDEAHSAVAETYKLILESLVVIRRPNPKLLGLTATPGRTWADIDADEELANFFARRKVTLTVEGYDSPVDYLIDQGYLAKAKYKPLFHAGGVELSDADIKRVERELDIPPTILNLLARDELRNLAIVTEIERLMKRHRRILIFAATVEHSSLLASVLQMRGHDAVSVTANTHTKIRSQMIERYKERSDDVRIICNFGVLTTGFDAPQTSALVIARPTKSLVLYSQMVGRAIRGTQAGGNKDAEIVTVVDNALPGFRTVADAFNNWEDIWD